MVLAPVLKSVDRTFKDLLLGSVFYPVGLYVYPSANTTLVCGSFVISFEIRNCESSNFVLFKIVLSIQSPLRFHVNFRIDISVSEKNVIEILIKISLNL